MNPRFDAYLVGWLLILTAGFLLVPLAAAAVFAEALTPFLVTIALASAIGAAMVLRFRTADRRIRTRDGFLVVAGTWLAISVMGALPYLLAGVLGPVDALFESISGFTTTGSTVIADTQVASRSLLLWRAMSQWLGGMGIILFTIAILPLLGIGGMQLFKAEVPGPVTDKVRPRLAATARALWGVYVGFTAAEWVALRLAGMGPYEALAHSFTTLATGGFSTRNTSVGEFASPTVEWIIIVFMLLAGINFVLHYKVLTGRFRETLRDAELRYFLLVAGAGTALITFTQWPASDNLEHALRISAFQAISILTTTGYVTGDFEVWAPLAQVVLLVLMVFGGMAGSTGGGVKSLRTLLAMRSLRATLARLAHPHAVRPVKYGGEVVGEAVLAGIFAFFTAYAVIAAMATAVVAAHGYDLLTSLSSALTAISNVGPGLGEVGAYDNFAHFPGLVKMVLAACMLFGRLEIFTFLALFTRGFWR